VKDETCFAHCRWSRSLLREAVFIAAPRSVFLFWSLRCFEWVARSFGPTPTRWDTFVARLGNNVGGRCHRPAARAAGRRHATSTLPQGGFLRRWGHPGITSSCERCPGTCARRRWGRVDSTRCRRECPTGWVGRKGRILRPDKADATRRIPDASAAAEGCSPLRARQRRKRSFQKNRMPVGHVGRRLR
jgi:hypothetical protein